MRTIVIILSVFFCISNAVAQTQENLRWQLISRPSSDLHLPNKSAIIDEEVRAECQRTVDRINNSTLKYNTINSDKRIYFDDSGGLRKYVYEYESACDASCDYIVFAAYYNEKGELVYLYCYTDSNCDFSEEFYYVNNGKIIDFAFGYDCGCCEDENGDIDEASIKAYINSVRPVVGNDLRKTIGWELSGENFI